MLAKRIIVVLTYYKGVLFRTKKFFPDYRYTDNFIGNESIDEIVILDVSRNLNFRKDFYICIYNISNNCFVPISVGGMINKFSEIKKLQNCGADKIIVNSLAYNNPKEVKKIIDYYGSQFVIIGIDAKKSIDKYSVYINQGQKKINVNLFDYIENIQKLDPGEILLQSIDYDGSLQGYDYNLIELCKKKIKKPLLVCGGAGSWEHFEKALKLLDVDGVCTTNIFHFSEKSIFLLKKNLLSKKIYVR